MEAKLHNSEAMRLGLGPETGVRQDRWPTILIVTALAVLCLVCSYLVVEHGELVQIAPFASLKNPFLLLTAITLSALMLRYRQWGLFLLLVVVYLNLSQLLVRYHDLPSFLQLLALPLSLAALIELRRREGALRSPQALSLSAIAYALVILASSAQAAEPALADERFVEVLKSLLLYGLVVVLTCDVTTLRRSVWALLGAGSLLGGLGIVQVLTGDLSNEYGGLARVKNAHIYGDLFEPRIAGPLGDPNFFAQILVILVPLGLCVAWEEQRLSGRLLALASLGTLFGATVLTYSRGGALALAVVVGLSLLTRRRGHRQVALAAGLLAILVVFLPGEFKRRLLTVSQVLPGEEEVLHPDSSLEERRLFTTTAWRMFLDHPVFGVGAGNYMAHFDHYADEVGSVNREYEDPGQRRYPHSLYLEIGAETGLVGLGVFGLISIVSFVYLHRAHRDLMAAGETYAAHLARAFAIALVGYLVSSLFLHGHFQRYLWLLFAFAAATYRVAGGDGRPRTLPEAEPTT